jgi:23S rRNA pseudouridine1911/1915/1917 synthase
MDGFKAGPEDAGRRIDLFLTKTISDLTRNACQRHMEDGAVTVNGLPVAKNYRLRAGDTVNINLAPPTPHTAKPEKISLYIVYEDDDIIVIIKPRGMVVHPSAGHDSGTLVNALLFHCGESLSGINGVMRPGIVHRLDKETSGLLVAAKNDHAHQGLTAQWADNTVTRIYHALCFNNIKQDTFIIDEPITRHSVNRKKMAVSRQKNARAARTRVRVMERYGKFTLIEARLETGRTHQIRVHMAFIGHPIVGDTLYGKSKFGLDGQVLHAKTLGFFHPSNYTPLHFDADWPEYFNEAVIKAKEMM